MHVRRKEACYSSPIKGRRHRRYERLIVRRKNEMESGTIGIEKCVDVIADLANTGNFTQNKR
jgi:hypothetical protein